MSQEIETGWTVNINSQNIVWVGPIYKCPTHTVFLHEKMTYLIILAVLLNNPDNIQMIYPKMYEEYECLSTTIYLEARDQSENGQIAVGEVILARVSSDKFPNTICEVVHQKKQFSCYNKKVITIKDKKSFMRAKRLAIRLLFGAYRPVVGKALYYHNLKVRPSWSEAFNRKIRLGRHIFYTDGRQ